jgi:hypothetical protein
VFLLKSLPRATKAQAPDREEWLVAEYRWLRDRETANVRRRRREEAELQGLDRRRETDGISNRARNHAAHQLGACPDPENEEDRQRDERDGGRYA